MAARLFSDTRGAAIVEFALAATFIFMVLLPFADYALYASSRKDMEEAVYRAALYAVANPDAIDAQTLTRYINANHEEGEEPLTVTIKCNGGDCSNTSRTTLCLDGSSSGPVFSSPAEGECAGGDAPGYFITISARSTYSALLGAGSALHGEPVAATLTARLQ